MNKLIEKIGKASLAMMLSIPTLGSGITAFAQERETESTTDGETQVSTSYPEAQDGYTYVSSVASYSQEENSVTLNLEAGERIRFTFLENNVFRMYMALLVMSSRNIRRRTARIIRRPSLIRAMMSIIQNTMSSLL